MSAIIMGQTCCIIHCTYFWVLKCGVCWCVWDAKESAVYLCLFPILYGTMSGKIISLKWRAVGMPRHEKGGERPTPRERKWSPRLTRRLVSLHVDSARCMERFRLFLLNHEPMHFVHRWRKINIDFLHPYIECLWLLLSADFLFYINDAFLWPQEELSPTK